MRLSVVALAALGSLPAALGRMKFLSPPAWTDSASRPVRVIGSTLDLQWTASQLGKKLSVVLYQLNATEAVSFSGQFHYTQGPFEFITRKSARCRLEPRGRPLTDSTSQTTRSEQRTTPGP